MEFHEIPWRVSRFLRVVGEHWVAKKAPGRVQLAGARGSVKRTLRVWLWMRAGKESIVGRHLRPSCGVPWCCHPEHCGYPKRVRRYDKRQSPGRGSATISDEYERGLLVESLERRGFVRRVGAGALRVGEYREHARKLLVTWQEPARGWYPKASPMARRIFRSRAQRAAQREAA